MIKTFMEWCIKETTNPFLHMQQKQGDFVYFGVHDISKKYRETGELPVLREKDLMDKLGQCVDADHVEQTISVYAEQDPFRLGYRKLESLNSRRKRKGKMEDSIHEIDIPVDSLRDITHMLGEDADLGDNKLWLVIDTNSSFQQSLMKAIRRKEIGKESTSEEEGEDLALEPSEDQQEA